MSIDVLVIYSITACTFILVHSKHIYSFSNVFVLIQSKFCDAVSGFCQIFLRIQHYSQNLENLMLDMQLTWRKIKRLTPDEA